MANWKAQLQGNDNVQKQEEIKSRSGQLHSNIGVTILMETYFLVSYTPSSDVSRPLLLRMIIF